uniref:N-myc downstream regulated 1b n=1 Tax=Oreochromis aureus TaxID=47969 RepID=A0A668UBC8_OREAU
KYPDILTRKKKNIYKEFGLFFDASLFQEEHVETQYGNVHCIMTRTLKANHPAILTFHDVGLNHKSCFETLFNHQDMHEIIRHFPVCHVEAPGQHEAAKTLPAGHTYPTMDQLSEALPSVLKHFGVIGLGVGAGAYILARFALNHPDLVDGLVLININPSAEGLMDTFATKVDNITSVSNLQDEILTNHDLIATYRHHITTTMNQANVSQFFCSYNHRNALEVERPIPGGNINVRTLNPLILSFAHHRLASLQQAKLIPDHMFSLSDCFIFLLVCRCSTLLIVGDHSPAVDAVVDCNSKLNPTKTTLLKMADCGGLPQVDQPAKVIEAFKYFIQGMGYLSSASMTRLRSRTTSSSSLMSLDGPRSRAHTNELQRSQISSHSNDEKRVRSHTDVSMDSISSVNQSVSKATEVAC